MFKNISIFKKTNVGIIIPKCSLNAQGFSLLKFPLKNFAISRSGMLRKDYEKEKAIYNKEKKVLMKTIQKEFWEEQTKVENEWLLNFFKTQKDKKKRDEAKLRSSIIKNSMICYQNIKSEIEHQQEFIAKQKAWREQDTEILLEKHSLLTMLDREAEESWLTPENIDTKLSVQMNKILPPTILSHKDYYNRLNRYALLLEQGLDKEAEDSKLNEAVLKFKNKKLTPIYDELKMVIKHLTYTEEHSTFDLFRETMNRIDNYLAQKENSDITNHLKNNLTYLFKKLITLIRLENEKPDNKIEIIENQMKSLVMILVLWNKYVDIIYMPESDVNELMDREKSEKENIENIQSRNLDELVSEKDPRMLKEYYFSRILEKKSKGTGLFINNINGLYDDAVLRKEVEEKTKEDVPEYKNLSNTKEYSSDEDLPRSKGRYTDDADKGEVDSSNFSDLKMDKKNQKKKEVKNKIQGKGRITEQKRKLLENEDFEVFKEDEEEEDSVNFDEFKNSKLSTNLKEKSKSTAAKQEATEELAGEKKPKKSRHLLEEYMLKNIKLECERNPVSSLDSKKEYEIYKSSLLKDLGLSNEKELFEDIENELQDVELSKIIDINEYETELKKEQERMTIEKEFRNSEKEDLFKSSLFNTIVKYSKDIFDFKQPKITSSLDIYDENLIKFLEFSRDESNIVYKSQNSSIVMEFLKQELNNLSDENLTPANRLKRKHLIRLADICGSLKITDSQNLKSVFDMFKHSNIKFDR